jgi:hypothetical protein
MLRHHFVLLEQSSKGLRQPRPAELKGKVGLMQQPPERVLID